MFCGMGPPGDSLLIEVSVYVKGLRHIVRAGTAWGVGATAWGGVAIVWERAASCG